MRGEMRVDNLAHSSCNLQGQSPAVHQTPHKHEVVVVDGLCAVMPALGIVQGLTGSITC